MKEDKKLPKAKCLVCGRVYHGWALKYKDSYCCGVKLITERERIRKKTIKDLALESIAKDLNIVNICLERKLKMKTLTKKEQLEKAFRSIIQSFGINDGLDNLVSQLIREVTIRVNLKENK